jgi:ATP phosphoribosyltransferase regulatory subunit
MSFEDRWLLPEGIDEVLPPHAARLESLRRNILDLFSSWGYELVIPPLIEYLESLLTGMGRDLDLQTFKLTDQLTGRLIGVRADMTPQVARVDAHRLKRDVPTRLCYLGPVLHALPNGFAGSRNPFQIGAELYGHEGLESDAEVILLMLETLKTADITSIYLDLGHMRIFRGLARQANLNADQEGLLFDILQRKARPEMEAYLKSWQVDARVADMLIALVELNGDASVLEAACRSLEYATRPVRQALEDLALLAQLVRADAANVHLHFDLAELRGYHYHTGAMFAAYIPGQGQALARGGRYDDIGQVFGRARPATGFSTDLKTLAGLQPEEPIPEGGIYTAWPDDPALAAEIKRLRRAGNRVICALPSQQGGPQDMDCNKRLAWQGDRWVVVDL